MSKNKEHTRWSVYPIIPELDELAEPRIFLAVRPSPDQASPDIETAEFVDIAWSCPSQQNESESGTLTFMALCDVEDKLSHGVHGYETVEGEESDYILCRVSKADMTLLYKITQNWANAQKAIVLKTRDNIAGQAPSESYSINPSP